jgi:hypothetical protein
MMATAESVLERAVQHGGAHVEEGRQWTSPRGGVRSELDFPLGLEGLLTNPGT